MRLWIKNGRIVDPANGIDAIGDVAIADGKIISVLNPPAGFTPDGEIDAGGKVVCPAIVDLCARLREPGLEHKATIASEAAAAASGGITTVCCPPDTLPVIDTPAVVELIHQRAGLVNKIQVCPIGALTHGLEGERLAEMHALKSAGCVGVSNAAMPVNNTEVLRRAMEYAASFNITIFMQARDHYLHNNGVVHEGALSTRLGLPPIPAAAETVAVSRVLLLMELTGARVHFCRLSAAGSIAMIADAKRAGLPVTADAGICHLHLTEDDVDQYNVNCHLNPPLRNQQDREALINGIREGTIDAVCSDHQPHDDDAKAAPFSETEPGASTIELLLSLMGKLVCDGGLSLHEAITALTVNPASILGLELGSLTPGNRADIMIVDPDRKWRVDNSRLLSAGKNSPFAGWELTGKVTHTLYRGGLIYEE